MAIYSAMTLCANGHNVATAVFELAEPADAQAIREAGDDIVLDTMEAIAQRALEPACKQCGTPLRQLKVRIDPTQYQTLSEAYADLGARAESVHEILRENPSRDNPLVN